MYDLINFVVSNFAQLGVYETCTVVTTRNIDTTGTRRFRSKWVTGIFLLTDSVLRFILKIFMLSIISAWRGGYRFVWISFSLRFFEAKMINWRRLLCFVDHILQNPIIIFCGLFELFPSSIYLSLYSFASCQKAFVLHDANRQRIPVLRAGRTAGLKENLQKSSRHENSRTHNDHFTATWP